MAKAAKGKTNAKIKTPRKRGRPGRYWEAETLSIKGREETQFAVARTASPSNPDALQGFHAKNLLFLIDEAAGVDERIFNAARGALSTKGARLLMTANPTKLNG